MSTRRPRIRRKLWPLFLVVLISAQVFMGIVHTTPAHADAASDSKRRLMAYAVDCLYAPKWAFGSAGNDPSNPPTQASITSLSDLSNYQLNGGPNADAQVVVVGLDIDTSNGVQACSTVVRNAIRSLTGEDLSDTDADTWLLNKVTGSSDFSGNKPLQVNFSDYRAMYKLFTDAYSGSPAPDADTTRIRALGAIGACYTVQSTADKKGYAFTEQGYYFYPKTNSDVMAYATGSLGEKPGSDSGS